MPGAEKPVQLVTIRCGDALALAAKLQPLDRVAASSGACRVEYLHPRCGVGEVT